MYQALYRKWRPQSFDDVVGQGHITETLKRQVATGRLSHAYLFTGTRGTGKTTCAKILAKAVNCAAPAGGNPCNACRFCRGIDDGSILDVVEMDAASNNGVDNVRALRDEAVFSPAAAKKRVYIIDEVHMLSVSAFNALLKILEEPPEHLMFILATTELNKVPATILSRCQRHAFKRLDTDSILRRLEYVAEQEGLSLTQDAAALIAGLSEGGMRDALSMLDQCSGRDTIDADTVYSALGLAGNRRTAELLRHIAQHDTAQAITVFERLWQEGKNPAAALGELSTLLRDLLLCAVAPAGGRELLSGWYDAATLSAFSGVFPVSVLIAHIDRIQAALDAMRSGQARTICELCLISLSEPGLDDSLPMLRRRIEALEARLQEGVPAAAPIAKQIDITLPKQEQSTDSTNDSISKVYITKDSANDSPDSPPFDLAPPPRSDADAPPPFSDADAPPPFSGSDAPPAAVSPAPFVSPPAPVAAASAAEGTLWERVLAGSASKFPGGLMALLSDPTQVSASLNGDTLTLRVQNQFALNQLDRPDITGTLSVLAGAAAGHPVRVRVTDQEEPDGAPSPASADKLDRLKQFSIVQFK